MNVDVWDCMKIIEAVTKYVVNLFTLSAQYISEVVDDFFLLFLNVDVFIPH